MAGVVFVNPGSGPSETPVDDVRAGFPGAALDECDGAGLEQQVRDAVAGGATFVAIAGGDGSMRAAAQVLADGDIPLVPIPAGTRNHFAKDVGIEDFDGAAAAAANGTVMRVDTGWVNGMVFVNNSSIGVYPKIVARREAHQRRLPKGAAHIVAAWEQIRHGRRVDVTVGDDHLKAWLVFVGNGEYGVGMLDLADRESLTDGVLDVRVVRADAPFARLRIIGALFLGRLARSPLVVTYKVPAITIDVKRHRAVEVALDGEVEMMPTPLQYESKQASLPVLVPALPSDT